MCNVYSELFKIKMLLLESLRAVGEHEMHFEKYSSVFEIHSSIHSVLALTFFIIEEQKMALWISPLHVSILTEVF